MPSKPKTPCTACGIPCNGGRCEQHQRERRREYDEARGEDRQFYGTPRWRAVRKMKLEQDPLCAECERLRRGPVQARVVHHKIDRHERPELSFVMDNLESLCESCHNAETRRRMNQKR